LVTTIQHAAVSVVGGGGRDRVDDPVLDGVRRDRARIRRDRVAAGVDREQALALEDESALVAETTTGAVAAGGERAVGDKRAVRCAVNACTALPAALFVSV
jgi:hypothetical protein